MKTGVLLLIAALLIVGGIGCAGVSDIVTNDISVSTYDRICS